MGEDDNGDGHSVMLPECKQVFININSNQDRMNRALWGGEGTTGMVKDINDMKMQNRLLIFLGATLIGVIASVATSILILMASGKF